MTMTLGSKYSTGVVWQDFQHKQLMDLFFKIKQARDKDEGDDVFRYSLAFLAMYVNHHFKLEEKCMDIYYYPEAKAHKKEHKVLINKIKAFRKSYNDYSDVAVDELLLTLNKWIREHILGDDKKLGEHILSSEQRKLI